MRILSPDNLLKACTVVACVALAFLLYLALTKPAKCQGQWCPPIDCYSAGDCDGCVCIREAYPDPGYCVSLEG